MKVPVYGEPQAEARADVPAGVNIARPTGYDDLARGIERGADALGEGIDKAQREYEKEHAKAKHEARAVDVANGFAAYVGDATDKFHGAPSDPSAAVVDAGSTPGPQATPEAIDAAGAGDRTVQLPGIVNPDVDTGFLGTRGKSAAAAEVPLFKSLQARRDEIAAGLTDPDTKKLFLARVQEYDLELRAKAESHVSQQVEVSKQDAASNISDAAVRSAAADPGNDKLAAALFGEAAGAVHGLGRGEDFEGLHDRALRADIASARIDNLLAPGPHQNVEKAREVLDANREVLGKQLDNYERALHAAGVTNNGEALASSLLERARKPNGFVDEGAAIAAWSQIPPDQRTKEARVAFDNGLELAQKQETRVKAGNFDTGLTAYLQRHNLNDVPAVTKAWLKENDPKGWLQLERIQQEDVRHARGAGDAKPTDDQRWSFAQFDVDVKEHPDKYAAMSPAEFRRSWWDKFSKNDRERAAALFAGTHGDVKPEGLSPAEGRMLLERGRHANAFPQGNDVSKWPHDAALLYDAALRELEKRSTNYRQMKREPPPFELVQKWTDELMQKGKIPGSGFMGFFQKSTTKLEAQENGTEFKPTWNDAQKAEAVKKLQAGGLQPTDENVDTYLRKKNNLPSAPAQAPEAPKPSQTTDEFGLDMGDPAANDLESIQD